MKKIIQILIFPSLILFPFITKADFSSKFDQNQLQLEGDCKENIKIELSKKDGSVIYTGAAKCESGKYIFDDNLLQWNLPSGDYEILINGQRVDKKITIDKAAAEEKKAQDTMSQTAIASQANQVKDSSGAISSDNKFLQSFLGLQNSLLDMRLSIKETQYPSAVKTGIMIAIDGINSLVTKITNYIWLANNMNNEEKGKAAEELGTINQVENMTAPAIVAGNGIQ